ncbi:MAG TPA: DUF1361 domain-containing protein [Flavobacteriia bacterium]|nr:DUF1361 domain-containing protein [Flavobacteriia bacterium]
MKKAFFFLHLYAFILLAFRIYHTNSLFYGFMLWNLFLAYLPFYISNLITSKKLLWILFIIWLLFLPNSSYLITDLFHLNKGLKSPVWYDLLLLFTFSIIGIGYYFMSLIKIYHVIKNHYNIYIANSIIYCSIVLSCFGMYLGRYLRWNSWELFLQPKILLIDVITRITKPFEHPKTWGFTLGYSLLFIILFWFIKDIKIKATFAKEK